MKYRKKPVVIEAFFFGFHVYPGWFKKALKDGTVKLSKGLKNGINKDKKGL